MNLDSKDEMRGMKFTNYLFTNPKEIDVFHLVNIKAFDIKYLPKLLYLSRAYDRGMCRIEQHQNDAYPKPRLDPRSTTSNKYIDLIKSKSLRVENASFEHTLAYTALIFKR